MAKKFFFSLVTLQCAPLSCINPNFDLSNLTEGKVHYKCFDHKDYKDWKLRGTCRENLHYLWKRAVRIAGFPRNSYICKNCGETLEFS